MKKLLLLFFVVLSFSKCFAAIPEKPIGYVSDFAHVLSEPQAAQLSAYLSQYEQATSNEITVAIVPSLEGLTIEDYSIQLAEKWKVGKKAKDNGVLFLIAVNDHKMRIEVGYGLEGKLTDAASGEIIRDVVAPFFRQSQYAEGIYAGVRAITEKIGGSGTSSGNSLRSVAIQKPDGSFMINGKLYTTQPPAIPKGPMPQSIANAGDVYDSSGNWIGTLAVWGPLGCEVFTNQQNGVTYYEQTSVGPSGISRVLIAILVLAFIWTFVFRRLGFWGIPLLLSSGRGWGGGDGGGGWGGGSFSGGGGSFGGGGASGGW